MHCGAFRCISVGTVFKDAEVDSDQLSMTMVKLIHHSLASLEFLTIPFQPPKPCQGCGVGYNGKNHRTGAVCVKSAQIKDNLDI